MAPLFGAVTVLGAVLSSGNKVSSGLSSSADLNFYPVFSPRTHALLVIEPTCQNAAEPRQALINESLSNLDILGIMKKHLSEFEAVFIVKTMQWCEIYEVENIVPLFKDIFPTNKQENPNSPIHAIAGFEPVRSIKSFSFL